MQDPKTTSLEGVEKSFIDKASYQLGRVASGLSDLKNTGASIIGGTPDFIKEIPESLGNIYDRGTNIISKAIKGDISLFGDPFENDVDTNKTSFTQQEKAIGKQINDLGGFQMTKDILGVGGTLIPQVITGDAISKDLKEGIKKEDFESSLSLFGSKKEEINNKKYGLITDIRYKDIFGFENETKQAYLKLKGIESITDLTDYNSFKQSQFNKLSVIRQKSIIDNETGLTNELSKLDKEIDGVDTEMKTYIDQNLYGGQTKFEEINKKQNDQFKGNKTIEIQKAVNELAENKIDHDIVGLSNISKAADLLGFNKLKASIVDKVTQNFNYELGLIGADNIPGNEELAKKSRELNKAFYDMNIKYLNNYLGEKAKPENKGLSDLDLKKKVERETYLGLEESQKTLLRQREDFITSTSQFKEMMEAGNKWEKKDPRFALNLISYLGSTTQRLFDQVYDIDTDKVPHYIQQEMRSIVYSNEALKTRMASALTYNTDGLFSILGGGLAAKGTKLPVAFEKFGAKLTKGITLIPINIAGKVGTAKLIGNGVGMIGASQIYGSAIDPVIDNLMMEAPTKTVEGFNQISNMFFDMGEIVIGRGMKTSMNAISYKHLTGDQKDSIKEFKEAMSLTHGMKLTNQESKDFLDNANLGLYSTLFDPKTFTNTLEQSGGLYRLIKDHVVTMDKNDIKGMLTEGGFGLRRDFDKIVGMPLEYINNLKETAIKFDSLGNDPIRKQIIGKQLDGLLESYETAFVAGGGIRDGSVIDIKYTKDKGLLAIQDEAKIITDGLRQMFKKNKEGKYIQNTFDIIKFNEAVDKVNLLASKAQRSYGTKKYNDGITLLVPDGPSGFREVPISFDDIIELEDKTFKDLITGKKVTIKTKTQTYTNVSVKQAVSDAKVKELDKIIANFTPDIENYFNTFKSKYDENDNLFTLGKIKSKVKDLILKGGITKLEFISTDALYNKDIFDGFVGIANKVAKDFFGDKLVKDKPVYINGLEGVVAKGNEELRLASGKLVLDKLKVMDDGFVLSYGDFYGSKAEKNNGKINAVVYFLFGKKILDQDSIAKAIEEKIAEKPGSMAAYTNKVNSIKQEIIDFAFVDGKFDFNVGIENAGTLYSGIHPTGLYDEVEKTKELNLSKNKLTILVRDLLNIREKKSDTVDNIVEFVYDTFKDVPYSDTTEPMVHNLIYKYSKNKPLFDKIYKEGQNETATFKETFSQILINDNMAEALAKKIIDKERKTGSFEKKVKQIKDITIGKWEQYKRSLVLKRKTFELEQIKLESFISKNADILTKQVGIKTQLESELNNLKAKIESLKIQIEDKHGKFENDTLLKQYTEQMLNKFSKDAENVVVLKNLFETHADLFKKDISDLEATMKHLNEVKGFSNEKKQIVKNFSNDIQKTDFKAATDEELNLILTRITEADPALQPIMKDLLDARKENQQFIIMEDLENILNGWSKETPPIDYDAALEKNPYKTYLSGFLNNNDTNSINSVNETIIDYFTKKDPNSLLSKADEADADMLAKDYIERSGEDLLSETYIIKKETEQALVKTTDIKINNVDTLYKESPTFRKFVDSLLAESLDDKGKILYGKAKEVETINELNDLLTAIVEGTKINVVKGDNYNYDVSKELLDNLINNKRKILQEFKNINNRSDYKDKTNPSNFNYYRKFNGVKHYEKGAIILESIPDAKFEKIVSIDNMIKAEMDTVFFTAGDLGQAGIKYNFNEGVTSSINSKITGYKKNLIYKAINETDVDNALKLWNEIIELESPVEGTKFFYRLFNGYETQTDDLIFSSDKKNYSVKRGLLLDEMGITDLYNNGYIFAGNFGDKDSVFHFYKSKYADKINKTDRNKFQEYIYQFEYAFSNGYLTNNTNLTTFKDFNNKYLTFLDNIKDGENISLANFKEAFEKQEGVKDIILGIKDIKKRESATMSNYSTFDNVDIPLNTYVLAEDFTMPKEFEAFFKTPNVDYFNNFISSLKKDDLKKLGLDNVTNVDEKFIKEYFKKDTRKRLGAYTSSWNQTALEEFLNGSYTGREATAILMFKDYYNKESKNVSKTNDAIVNSFINDYEDGTSYVTQDIAILRARIQGIGNEKKIKELIEEGDYNEFKDHFFGEANGKRVLGKTLFNILHSVSSLDKDLVVDTKSVFIGASSLKLKGGYKKYDTPKKIIINGVEREILGEVSDTTTQYFKNAATDLFEEKSQQTVSDSIKSALSYLSANKISAIQEKKIKTVFNKLLKDIVEPIAGGNLYSELDKRIGALLQYGGLGIGSSSVLNNKLSDFLSEVSRITNKPKDVGQSMFIKKSDWKIGPNEMAISNKSKLYFSTRNDVANTQYGKNFNDLTKEEKDWTNANLYIVGFRYPVPSKYNTGLYKVRIVETDEELKEYIGMGKKGVISNPMATYLKLEGDNDGDHIFFVSAFKNNGKEDTMGEVLANELLVDSGIVSNITKAIKNGEVKNFNNKFIVADQVDKEVNFDESVTLIESRLSALDAKKRIGNVSATGRTIKNLSQMLDEGFDTEDLKLIKEEYKEKTKDDYTRIEVKKVPYNFSELNITKDFGKSFYEKYSSLLQLTLDFGNSNETRFKADWYIDLVGDLLQIKKQNTNYTNEELVEIHKFYYTYITPLSVYYKAGDDLKTINIKSITEELANNTKEESRIDYLYNYTGTKRQLMEKFYNQYGNIVKIINETNNIKWLRDEILIDGDFYKKIKDIKVEGESWGTEGVKKVNVQVSLESILTGNDIYLPKADQRNLKKILETPKINSYREKIIKDKYTFGNYMDNLFKLGTEIDKKEVANLRKKLYGEGMINRIKELGDEYYHAAILTAMASGEYKIINMLTNKDKILNLKYSTQELNSKIDKLNKQIAEELKMSKVDNPDIVTQEEALKKIDMYNDMINLSDKEKAETGFELNLEKEIIDLKSKLDSFQEVEKVGQINTMPDAGEKLSYELPEIQTNLVDADNTSMFQVLGGIENAVLANNRAITLRVSSIVAKYMPWFVAPYNTIKDFMNQGSSIRNAMEEHIRHFSDSWILADKNGITRIMKGYGISNANAREIQYSLIDYKDGKFSPTKISPEFITTLKTSFKDVPEKSIDSLLSDVRFVNALQDYSDKVIVPLSIKMNGLELMGYKIYEAYHKVGSTESFNTKYSMIIDTLESHKSNAQLGLRMSGIKSEAQFRNRLKETNASEGTINLLVGTLFNHNQSGFEKLLGYLKNIHYFMTYGTGSRLTGNGIWAALAQITPNALELKAHFVKNYDQMKDAMQVMQNYGILGSESLKDFGGGLGQDHNGGGLINSLWTKSERILGVNNHPRLKDASKMLNMIVTNPLGAGDYPLEVMRKIVAVSEVMRTAGIKNSQEFNRKATQHGDNFVGMFRHYSSEKYAESGGGVVSTSGIYRDTVFSHANYYFDNIVTKFFVSTMSYLMGWSFHKAATSIEREYSFISAIGAMKNGDWRASKAFLSDWFAYNSIVAKNLAYTTGLYLKLEKYEDNPNEHVSLGEFQKSFNNQIVALEILLDKHISNWNMADELGGDYGDKLGFTTYGIVQHMFRLFKQPQFIATMLEHHKLQTSLGNEAIWQESFKFAMDQHYTGYVRFNGLEYANDLYDSNTYNSTVNIMGVGGKDAENELFQNLFTGKQYSKFTDEGFIGSLMKYFNGLTPFKSIDEGGYNTTTQATRQLFKIIMDDPELGQLVRGGNIGEGVKDYNLSNLIGKPGDKLTEETQKSIEDIFRLVSNYGFNQMNATGTSIEDKHDSKEATIYRDRISKILKEYDLDFDSTMGLAKTDSDRFLKILAVLEDKFDIPNIIPLSLFLNQEKANMRKDFTEKYGTDTGLGYKQLEKHQWNELEREVLLKYQPYLNLNADVVFQIIGRHVETKHADLLKKMEDTLGNTKFSKYDVVGLVNKSYLIGSNIKEDTNVTKLHSRYALAFKGIGEGETAVRVANQFLKGIYEHPTLSGKAKNANAAALIMGMSKSTYNLLKDNEEFNKLSEEAKKIITNRMYKVSKDGIDFDSSMYTNAVNEGAYGKGSNGRMSMSRPSYKSKAFEGGRPNFSKQSQPVRDMLGNKVQYIQPGYLDRLNRQEPQYSNFPINIAKSPIVRKYNKFLLEQMFYGFKSKGVVNTYKIADKFDSGQKKSIKLKATKKIKRDKPVPIKKQSKKYTRGMNPNLPLSQSGGE